MVPAGGLPSESACLSLGKGQRAEWQKGFLCGDSIQPHVTRCLHSLSKWRGLHSLAGAPGQWAGCSARPPRGGRTQGLSRPGPVPGPSLCWVLNAGGSGSHPDALLGRGGAVRGPGYATACSQGLPAGSRTMGPGGPPTLGEVSLQPWGATAPGNPVLPLLWAPCGEGGGATPGPGRLPHALRGHRCWPRAGV